MLKIESLIKLAIDGAGIPSRIFLAKTGKSAVDINYLITPNLLIPIIIATTNIRHHQMFGDELIVVEGGIKADNSALSGLIIAGDLILKETNYPLGFILISLTSTISSIKKTFENGDISDFIAKWKAIIPSIGNDGDVLRLDKYKNLIIPAK